MSLWLHKKFSVLFFTLRLYILVIKENNFLFVENGWKSQFRQIHVQMSQFVWLPSMTTWAVIRLDWNIRHVLKNIWRIVLLITVVLTIYTARSHNVKIVIYVALMVELYRCLVNPLKWQKKIRKLFQIDTKCSTKISSIDRKTIKKLKKGETFMLWKSIMNISICKGSFCWSHDGN